MRGVENCPYFSLGIRKGLYATCMRSWFDSQYFREKKKKKATYS